MALPVAGFQVFSLIAVAAIINGPNKENDTVHEVEANLRDEAEEEERPSSHESHDEGRVLALERTMEAVNIASERRVGRSEQLIKQLAEGLVTLPPTEETLKPQVYHTNPVAEHEPGMHPSAEITGGPQRWPTREEFHRALHATRYSQSNFHFAVVGGPGSGRSSLINAFRNLHDSDPRASPTTGISEPMTEIGRYPDPGGQPPRQYMVWFDVPSTGSLRGSNSDYFIEQGLFVFDCIILVIGNRFDEADAGILADCARFKIPAFIVRSKADVHIMNLMRDYGNYRHINDNPELYEKCQDQFIRGTQDAVDEAMQRSGLPHHCVYVVSRNVLQQTCNDSLQTSNLQSVFTKPENNLLHESYLVNELLTAAARRRCGPKDEKDKQPAATQSSLRKRTDEGPAEKHDQGNFFAANQENQELESQVFQDTVSGAINAQHRGPHTRKIIYPHNPIEAEELYDEIIKHAPELSAKLVRRPRMLTPKVAMLTFYPHVPIPSVILAFGARLRVAEYRERAPGTGRGGRVGIADIGWTGDELPISSGPTRGNLPRGSGYRGRRRGRADREL